MAAAGGWPPLVVGGWRHTVYDIFAQFAWMAGVAASGWLVPLIVDGRDW